MVPIVKKRVDTLVEILSSKSSSGESFDVAKYIYYTNNNNNINDLPNSTLFL